jgi:hypothetical protein
MGEEGQSRLAASKSRLETLEKLLATLQSSSFDQAEKLLQQIRVTDDPVDVLNAIPGPSSAAPDSAESGLTSFQRLQEAASKVSSSKRPVPSSSSGEGHVVPRAQSANTDLTSVSGLPREILEQRRMGGEVDAVAALEPSSDASLLTRRLLDLRQPRLPDASITEKAVASFFNCSGKLFHVFQEDEIAQCFQATFHDFNASLGDIKTKICSLMAVAAVGAQYTPDAFSKEVETVYYDLARHFFDFTVEKEPLSAIKVCTLLAQYNVMNKAMVSLTYVGKYLPCRLISFRIQTIADVGVPKEFGLCLSRLHGLSDVVRPHLMTASTWTELRKAWRTLVFFSRRVFEPPSATLEHVLIT